MTDLDRLLELEVILKTVQPLEFNYAMKLEKEFESLKAKIEGKIDEGIQQEKADLLSILDMKDEEVAKLKEELNGVKFGETKNLYDIIDEYKSTLDKIREFNILLNNQYLEDLLAKHEGKQ